MGEEKYFLFETFQKIVSLWPDSFWPQPFHVVFFWKDHHAIDKDRLGNARAFQEKHRDSRHSGVSAAYK